MTSVRGLTRSLLVVVALATACDGSLPAPCEDGSCGSQASWRKTFQSTVSRNIDLLFVIDDTPAIAPFAGTVAAGLTDMAADLAALPGLQPASLHVGVVRAGRCDSSTRGAACGVAGGEQFLRAEWCESITNFQGALADGLACMADFGATNCAPAQPLAAAMDALATPPRPGWEGFLRPEAYLMVVVIAGADDASAQAAIAVANVIKGLKADPSQAVASVIAPQSCAAAGAPQRLVEFVNQFGANGLVLDLCTGPIRYALQRITETINYSLEPACLRRVRDTDLATPGLQPSCVFEDHPRTPDGGWTTAILPSCDSAAPPCWRLSPSQGTCDGFALDIQRATNWCAEAGTNITIECLSCADANDPACVPVR